MLLYMQSVCYDTFGAEFVVAIYAIRALLLRSALIDFVIVLFLDERFNLFCHLSS